MYRLNYLKTRLKNSRNLYSSMREMPDSTFESHLLLFYGLINIESHNQGYKPYNMYGHQLKGVWLNEFFYTCNPFHVLS